jgi:hypothetical protein
MVSMSLVLVNNTGKPHMGTHTYKIFLLIVINYDDYELYSAFLIHSSHLFNLVILESSTFYVL